MDTLNVIFNHYKLINKNTKLIRNKLKALYIYSQKIKKRISDTVRAVCKNKTAHMGTKIINCLLAGPDM